MLAACVVTASGFGCHARTGQSSSGWVEAPAADNAAIVALAADAPAPAAGWGAKGKRYVALKLRPGRAARREPIRTGVPLPMGAIGSPAHLALFAGEANKNDGNKEVPAQFDVLARWPDGSIKDVLVQIVGDLGPAASYRLAYGDAVTRKPAARVVSATMVGGKATVDTGLVRFTIDRKGVLDTLFRDANGDGKFTGNEQIIDRGDIAMVNAFDGQEYAAADATVTFEESGPVRAVALARGVFTSAKRDEALKYQVRYYASVGSDKVDAELTIIDDQLEPDVTVSSKTLAVAIKNLAMRWHCVADGPRSFRFGSESGKPYAGTVAGDHYLLQTGAFNYVNGDNRGFSFAYSGVGTGSKAPGWVAVDAGKRNLTVMVRDFWQQFPTELDVNGDTVSAVLFPARSINGAGDTTPIVPKGETYRRPNTLYFLEHGGAKTYQVRLTSQTPSPSTEEIAAANDAYQAHQLALTASPEWYTSTGVWGEIGVGGPDSASASYDEDLMEGVYRPSLEKPGDASMYGWRDYGDRLRSGWADVRNGQRIPSFYDDTHVGANNFFRQFLRTGDQRWYQLGDIATRHFMDIDVSHGPRQGYWKTGGRPQPAGEPKFTAHENIDHEMGNIHRGHAHVSGLTELYLLTGDKRAFEVLKEMAGWWRFTEPYLFPRPFDARKNYREAERDYAWPLYVMNEWVRVTGDSNYHRDVAGPLVQFMIDWWQTPLPHIGYDPKTDKVSDNVLGTNDAKAGTGYWTMSLMDNHGPTSKATGCNPWMAGALISNLIKFYEQDRLFAAVGRASGISHPVLRDMLLQGQNYVVKYGYVKSKDFFVYSEAMRDGDGGGDKGDHHILYGLAYLDRMFKQERAAGTLPHPEWYDTQPLWLQIASRRYDELRTVPGHDTQSYGFYGYEIIYPPDFFKIMRDTLRR